MYSLFVYFYLQLRWLTFCCQLTCVIHNIDKQLIKYGSCVLFAPNLSRQHNSNNVAFISLSRSNAMSCFLIKACFNGFSSCSSWNNKFKKLNHLIYLHLDETCYAANHNTELHVRDNSGGNSTLFASVLSKNYIVLNYFVINKIYKHTS